MNTLQTALPSFRRRPEASGLFDPFPPGGHDNTGGIPAGLTRAIGLTSRPAFVGLRLWTGSYGQDVLYAARGQEARSRDGQDVLYAARGQEARSRDGQDVLYAARGQDARSRPVCGERAGGP